jgi:hypothetical protein
MRNVIVNNELKYRREMAENINGSVVTDRDVIAFFKDW